MADNKKNIAVKCIFPALLIIAVIIRIIHLCTMFDPETGFYTDPDNFSVYLFYALTVIGCVGFLITERIISKPAELLKERKINSVTAIGLVVLGAVLIFDCTSDFSTLMGEIRNSGFAFKSLSSAMGGTVYVLLPVFQILAAAVFILHAISAVANLHFENKIKVVNLFPVFWALFEVVKCFTVTASYTKQSELFVQIFAYTFAMIALLGYARFTSGIGIKESGFYFMPCCAISSVFCFMAICYAIVTGGVRENIVFFAMLVFFVLMLVSIKLEGKRLQKAETAEEPAAAENKEN